MGILLIVVLAVVVLFLLGNGLAKTVAQASVKAEQGVKTTAHVIAKTPEAAGKVVATTSHLAEVTTIASGKAIQATGRAAKAGTVIAKRTASTFKNSVAEERARLKAQPERQRRVEASRQTN